MTAVPAAALEISSTAVQDKQPMSAQQVYHDCGGENISPDLRFAGVPAGAKSLALIVHDPDAPHPHGWYHWLVADIPVTVAGVAKGAKFALPARELPTDFGKPGYNGPCPPKGSGPHHYHFILYALDVEKIELPAGMTPYQVHQAIRLRAVKETEITGLYERK